MKKFMVLWFMVLIVLSACDKKNGGIVVQKGIDKIDIVAMMDGLSIKSTDADEKYQELFWLQIRGFGNKVFVNQYCYETTDVGDVITLSEENMDLRFSGEY